MKNYADDILEELDAKLDEVDVLINRLPLKSAVKKQLLEHIYALWEEIEDNLDMTPVDFEHDDGA
jgi:hypothetical protein